MITLCDEGTPGGPVWLWGGCGAAVKMQVRVVFFNVMRMIIRT